VRDDDYSDSAILLGHIDPFVEVNAATRLPPEMLTTTLVRGRGAADWSERLPIIPWAAPSMR
jgi:hypothetical protein